MANTFQQKPPAWFRILSVVLVLWGLIGCVALYVHIAYGPAIDPNATDWDRAYYAAMPAWFTPVYCIAIFGGLLGAIALVARSALAKWPYLASLIAVLVQFGWVFFATDLLTHKGAAATVPFPTFIIVVAAFQLWLAGHAAKRGWIG